MAKRSLVGAALGVFVLGFVSQAATGLATPVLLRYITDAAATGAAATSGPSIANIREDTAGEIICPPGAFLGVYSTAAGTTPLLVCSMTWAEIPVASL